MYVKPDHLLARHNEWQAMTRFVERQQRLALVYGPRRVGKSFLLDALCQATGGRRFQAISGTPRMQLADFGRALGEWSGTLALALNDWTDAFRAVAQLQLPVVVIDEFPFLTDNDPSLVSIVQRYVDEGNGPPLVLAGSATATMAALLDVRAPLYGRASAIVVPTPFHGSELADLWSADPQPAFWVDAALGGLPGFRQLLGPPTQNLDAWMIEEVLAPGSPVLDAAELALIDHYEAGPKAQINAIVSAIAAGEHSFAGIARRSGIKQSALARPLDSMRRSGLLTKVPDVLRAKRDRWELADPHLRFWLSLVAPRRFELSAGRASTIWDSVVDTTWPSNVAGPRWEEVVRHHLILTRSWPTTGATVLADPTSKTGIELDIVALDGKKIVAIGEAKLRTLTDRDAARLDHARTLLGAPDAELILASPQGATAHGQHTVITVDDIYGSAS